MLTYNNKLYIISFISIILAIFICIFLCFFEMYFEASAIFIISLAPTFYFLDTFFLPKFFIGPHLYLYLYHLLGYSIGPLAQRYLLEFEAFDQNGMVKAQFGCILGLATYIIISIIILNFFKKKSITKDKISNIKLTEYINYTFILFFSTLFIILFSYFSGGIRRIGMDDVQEVSNSTHSIISAFINIQYILFFFLGYISFIKKGKWLYFSIIFYLLFALFYAIEGNRGQMVFAFLFLISGLVWGGVPKKKITKYILLFLFLFIPLAGMIDIYRSTTTSSNYNEGFIKRFTTLTESLSKNDVNNGTSNLIIAPFIYAVSVHTADVVFKKTPSNIPYAGFDNIFASLYGFIPSFFKVIRPDIEDGSYIAAQYGIGFGKGSKSWEYTPSVAEGYRRFGWVGIFIIYAISGILFSTLFGIFYNKKNSYFTNSILMLLFLSVPGVWSFTFNYLFFYFLFVLTRYFILFLFFYFILNIKYNKISFHD